MVSNVWTVLINAVCINKYGYFFICRMIKTNTNHFELNRWVCEIGTALPILLQTAWNVWNEILIFFPFDQNFMWSWFSCGRKKVYVVEYCLLDTCKEYIIRIFLVSVDVMIVNKKNFCKYYLIDQIKNTINIFIVICVT